MYDSVKCSETLYCRINDFVYFVHRSLYSITVSQIESLPRDIISKRKLDLLSCHVRSVA